MEDKGTLLLNFRYFTHLGGLLQKISGNLHKQCKQSKGKMSDYLCSNVLLSKYIVSITPGHKVQSMQQCSRKLVDNQWHN